ncbi:MAG TPA: putative toxin, partial [Thermoanaerobaculia bacterium]|nr:putative toxin [Thermoanaerobaculia bacterium]
TIGNPIKLVDRNGAFWDYVADVVGLGWDIYQFAKEPSWGNAGFIGLDVVLGAIPFIPNTGAAKLGAKGVNALSDGLSLIAHNAEAGKAFEELVVAALQATKNKGEAVVVEGLGKSIPDILAKGGITEIKLVTSGRKVSYTRQLKIQIAAAQKAGVKFTLILSPGAKVTGPLEKAILEAGGTIVHFDPRTGMLLPYANVCG